MPLQRSTRCRDFAPLAAKTTLPFGETLLFGAGSTQDPDNSEEVIAALDQGGLGFPIATTTPRMTQSRKRFARGMCSTFRKSSYCLGDKPAMRRRTRTRSCAWKALWPSLHGRGVERRDPYNLKNKMAMAGIEQLAPDSTGRTYFQASRYPHFETVNVGCPKVLPASERIAEEVTPRKLEDVSSLPCGRRIFAIPFAAVCGREFQLSTARILRGAKE